MANIINYTEFVLEQALSDAIEKFEKNVKGEYVCTTERGIRIKINDTTSNKITQCLVVPKSTKVAFENLNGSASLSFNHITKDNAKYAYTYYKQIMSLRHSLSIVKKLDSMELKKLYLVEHSKENTLFDKDKYYE